MPEYAPKRLFEPVEYHGTLVWFVYSALRAERSGDVEKALRLLDDALAQWPDNGMLFYEQSWLYLKQDRFAEAQRMLERSVGLFPTHPPILDLLVTAALATGDARAALDPMRVLATQVEPTLANRLRLAKVLAHNSDRSGAAAILSEVTSAAPEDAQVWRDVSEVRLIRGELSEARLALETAIGLAPLQAGLYHRHGEVLLKLRKPGRAVASLRHALALDPRQAAWWRLLVEALGAAGDDAGVLQAVDEACAQCPDDSELQAAMAEARRLVQDATASRSVSPEHGPSTGTRQARRVRALVSRLAGVWRTDRLGGNAVRPLGLRPGLPGQDAIRVAQLRSALGVAERRLEEAEQRMHQELEGAWSQANSLEGALQELDASLAEATAEREAAWTQAHALASALEAQTKSAESARMQAERLDQALTEQNRNAESAWEHARQLDAALAEQAKNAEVAWAQAQRLDAALAEREREVQAGHAEIERLHLAVSDRDRRLHTAWEHAHRLDAALQENQRELAAMRFRLGRLERELSEATSDGLRVGAPR